MLIFITYFVYICIFYFVRIRFSVAQSQNFHMPNSDKAVPTKDWFFGTGCDSWHLYIFPIEQSRRIFTRLSIFINNGCIAPEVPSKNGRTMLSTVRPPDQSAETQTKWKAILLTCFGLSPENPFTDGLQKRGRHGAFSSAQGLLPVRRQR